MSDLKRNVVAVASSLTIGVAASMAMILVGVPVLVASVLGTGIYIGMLLNNVAAN